jgi:hypothetical protein
VDPLGKITASYETCISCMNAKLMTVLHVATIASNIF